MWPYSATLYLDKLSLSQFPTMSIYGYNDHEFKAGELPTVAHGYSSYSLLGREHLKPPCGELWKSGSYCYLDMQICFTCLYSWRISVGGLLQKLPIMRNQVYCL